LLSTHPFSVNSSYIFLWLVGIYVGGCIRKLLLVRAITKAAGNILCDTARVSFTNRKQKEKSRLQQELNDQ